MPLKLVQTRAEVAEIKAELAAAGFITVKNTKNKMPQAKSTPTIIKLSEDTALYIGKTTNKTITLLFQSAAAMIYGSIPKTFPVRTLF